MPEERSNLMQQAARVLGGISILLGLGLVVWSLSQGMGLHGGGLMSIVLGVLAIMLGRGSGPASPDGGSR